jgi:hypothetical protein
VRWLQEGGIRFTDQLATPDNKPVAGCGRLKAAFDPTGQEHVEQKNSVARFREPQYFSNRVWAGSATAGTLSDIGGRRGGTELRTEDQESESWNEFPDSEK